ncbi:MAG: xanthine dehydrogenase family protein subunit M [bacterium]|nr:xanthine dehydrogenase family protein subunit M [Acidimicrobiia bacterium]MCY4650829.1 xanthine dehydrogenase family protein subunit M [bacterium]
MKPPPFKYARPESLDEVLRILSEYNGEARVLAGGQSLIPLLNFRLARPQVLVDIALVRELRQLEVERGVLRVGAAVTQNTVERSSDVARLCPLLTKALPFVGHVQNRVRGTVVGSIAHADPAAEMPAVALALQATMVARSAAGVRKIPADQFFLGPFTTALKPDEMLVEVRFPTSRKTRAAVTEVAPRSGDFAVAGVAGKLVTTRAGKARDVALALFGVGGSPQRLHDVEARLAGQRITGDLLDQVAALASHNARADSEDVHADAGYRAHVSGVLVRRAVEEMTR